MAIFHQIIKITYLKKLFCCFAQIHSRLSHFVNLTHFMMMHVNDFYIFKDNSMEN